MRITVEIGTEQSEDNPEIFAWAARTMLQGMVTINRMAIRAGEVPPIYGSGVRYQDEPPGVETFRDAVTTNALGHGDCAHFAAWRVAELLEAGEAASIRITWAPSSRGRLYHVVVRRENGSIEDPSRILGMT